MDKLQAALDEAAQQKAIAQSMERERDHYKSLLADRLAILERQFYTHVFAKGHMTELDRPTWNAINASQASGEGKL
jgi:hypothetical protein